MSKTRALDNWYGIWMRLKGPHNYMAMALGLICEVVLKVCLHCAKPRSKTKEPLNSTNPIGQGHNLGPQGVCISLVQAQSMRMQSGIDRVFH
jgi:hypothetical protein